MELEMSQTAMEKVLSAHLVEGELKPGEEIAIRIDQTLTQDATGTMAFLELEAMGVNQVATERSVSYVDHNLGQYGPNNMNDHLYLKSIADATGVVFSKAGNGICHQVQLERFSEPGKTLLGSDSHTPTSGGIAMVAIGAGGLDVALAMAGQPFRLTCPKILGIRLTGKLNEWISAKDVILKVLSILKARGNVGWAIEYFGPGVKTLQVPDRATITNMGAETGVTTSLFPSDAVTRKFLNSQGRDNCWQELKADRGAKYHRVIEISLSDIEPLCAAPSSPDNVRAVKELSDKSVGQIIIGSCTNSSYRDLMVAAAMLKGRKVNRRVSLSIAPGSRQVLEMIAKNGAFSDLVSSGARILECGCGPCIGQGLSPASGVVSLRTFNRNFPGRSGTTGDQVYLVGPEVAAASAITGKITDPRELGFEYPRIKMPTCYPIDYDEFIWPSGEKDIRRAETIGQPPECEPYPEKLHGTILIKVEDNITTDHIMPAGRHLKLRSNIPRYAEVVFESFNLKDEPTFAERALEIKNQGKHGVIVAGESYGQGSSREHAAICPMWLGVKLVLAKSIERIHLANLVNFGILPAIFENPEDYQKIERENELVCENVREAVESSDTILLTNESKGVSVRARLDLTARQRAIILAGGRLNYREQ
jgi:aconitate hydratase